MILKRIAHNKDGTFGVLIDGDVAFALTCENPWLNNKRNISCIPDGVYECKRTMYNRRDYEVFEVMDVPGRSKILLHKGNTMEDTEGCILVGEQFEPLGGVNAVLRSGEGFRDLMRRLEGKDSFSLCIMTV